jgi:hypothetical protein
VNVQELHVAGMVTNDGGVGGSSAVVQELRHCCDGGFGTICLSGC